MCVPICFLVATGRSPSQVRSSVRCSVRQQQLLFRCLRSSCAPRRARSSAGRIWTPVKPSVSRLTRWCVVFPSQCLLVSFFREESLLPVRLRGPVPQASARPVFGSLGPRAHEFFRRFCREQANCFSCFRLSARVPSHPICFLRSCAQRLLCPIAFSA
jgi:hypothetical protein